MCSPSRSRLIRYVNNTPSPTDDHILSGTQLYTFVLVHTILNRFLKSTDFSYAIDTRLARNAMRP